MFSKQKNGVKNVSSRNTKSPEYCTNSCYFSFIKSYISLIISKKSIVKDALKRILQSYSINITKNYILFGGLRKFTNIIHNKAVAKYNTLEE